MDKKDSAKKILKIAGVLAGFALMAALSVWILLLTREYGADYLIERLKDFVSSLGIWGIFFMLIIQTAQVILAFIPGEPIEIAAGALYGTFGGTALCLAGIFAGTFVIFLMVKTLGKDLVLKVIGSDKYSRLKFLKNPAKRDVLIFLLMFIPGTPKDVLTYFSPLCGMSMRRFLAIATFARIPSVVTSTYVGGTLAEGQYLRAALAFLAVGAVSICGILLYNKIIESKNAKIEDDQNNELH
ncbi:MAG: TVP38/TMEM64 family protein [Clostridia bacterium]|nr:TVP38/TMEM64 family protein [Clostridia bacterium]